LIDSTEVHPRLTVRAEIHVTGIVQGVGFRPFIYRVAKRESLKGYVLNLGDAGVKIIAEGNRQSILNLINELKHNPPSISRIESLDIEWGEAEDKYSDFEIVKSSEKRSEDAAPEIPPDIAVCHNCIEEMLDPSSRWYLYPFTACAACGPRFSTITDLPYDRPNTTMDEFPLCNNCNTGYTNPLNRRYHAQTTACPKCGPTYKLVSNEKEIARGHEAVSETVRLLANGSIVAIQGITGTHLATKTTELEPIRKLRNRKQRRNQPFAIMAESIERMNQFLVPSVYETELLESWKRPIVLIKKKEIPIMKNQGAISEIPAKSLEEIAPGLDTVGVMLPYAPLHHLLFHFSQEPAFVMTSANPSGIPMYKNPRTILSELTNIADCFLVHDREIHQRADDSVLKVVHKENAVFIRRSRGFVPNPIPLKKSFKEINIVGVGPEEKATASISKSGSIYMTQHIGDTNSLESLEFLDEAIQHMIHLLGIENLDAIACDLHPQFLSTEYAEEQARMNDMPLHRVQHHHAHLASILVDHELELDTRIVCITADGYGYGRDGSGWGGEILLGNALHYSRESGLMQQVYPGGDLSARFSTRALLSILHNSIPIDEIIGLVGNARISKNTMATKDSISVLIDMIENEINTLASSSTGRVLDAISLALGVCSQNTYDGECPMKLEAHARETDLKIEPVYLKTRRGRELDTTEFLKSVVELKKKGYDPREIAYAAQWSLGKGFAELAIRTADKEDIQHIGFSGGVALNRILTKAIVSQIEAVGKTPLIHKKVPPGDAGVSLGQVAVAAIRGAE
jgi:hydrogenase maturation protein HypF